MLFFVNFCNDLRFITKVFSKNADIKNVSKIVNPEGKIQERIKEYAY